MIKPTLKAFTLFVVLFVVMSLLVACAGCGKKEPIEYTMDDAGTGELTPTQEANLRTIDGAITTYWADNEKNPTDINELVPKYLKKIPTDDRGGVYVLTRDSLGKTVAGVRF